MQRTWLNNHGGAAATDGCGSVAWSYDLVSESAGGCVGTGSGIYQFTATDECGNTSVTQAEFLITDTQAPTAVCCTNFAISLGDDGLATLNVRDIDCGSTDNCTSQSQLIKTISQTIFTFENVGTNVVTLTVTDQCGNTATCTTTVTVNADASLGIAKRAVQVLDIPNGSHEVTYEFNVENYGSTPIENVQVTDLLATTFPGPCSFEVISLTSDRFTVNETFNGVTDINLLQGVDQLNIGEKGAILLKIRVRECNTDGPFNNQATATGQSADGTTLTDTSVNGANPDPNGDGNPSESSLTPVNFESVKAIGVAKKVVAASVNPDGSYSIEYEINVQNYSNTVLYDVQVEDNLGLVFPSPCAFEVVSLTSDRFTIGAYNGLSDITLLEGIDDLDPNDKGAILLTIKVTDCAGNLGPFYNSAFASSYDDAGAEITDASIDGSNPDPDYNGNPDEEGPTVVNFNENLDFGIAKRISYGPVSTDGISWELTYEIRVENRSNVELELLTLNENLEETFGAADSWTLLGIESDQFTVNPNYDGINDINLIAGGDILEVNYDEASVYVTVLVNPGDFDGPYLNSVDGSALSPLGGIAQDTSQNGAEADLDGDGYDDDNEPTPVTFGCCGQVGNILPDSTPPSFVNCPRPPVIVDAPAGWCSSFVNFSYPIAEDDCTAREEIVIRQIDTTGLSTGSLFPVGLTTLIFEAKDKCGNRDTCSIQIIVNDFHTPPVIVCPADTMVINQPLMCGAVVNDIAPVSVTDNCPQNLAVTYCILDPQNQIVDCGIEDASGNKFATGDNKVVYKVQDQPLLLITEVQNNATANTLEITNFGPSALDISALVISRLGTSPSSTVVPSGTILANGATYTYAFSPIADNAPAGYTISFINNKIDGNATNGYTLVGYTWSGEIIGNNAYRSRICDTDSGSDFTVIDGSHLPSIGTLNSNLSVFTASGSTVSLQSELASEATCSFHVIVKDTETPYCASLDTMTYVGVGGAIEADNYTVFNIDVTQNYQIGDVNLINLVGSYPNMGGITIKLVSPSGTTVSLIDKQCNNTANFDIDLDDSYASSLASVACGPLGNGGKYKPLEAFKAFFGESSLGTWKLEIHNTTGFTGTLNSFELQLSELIPFAQADLIINNEIGKCGSVYEWTLPLIGDNCCAGQIRVEYTSTDDIAVPVGGILNGQGGYKTTKYFNVGTTTVTYYIVDLAGNLAECSFDVTVKDTEKPNIDPVSCQDITINLMPGACSSTIDQMIPVVATDNCGIDTIIYNPPLNHAYEAGTSTLTITVVDMAGNSASCTSTITVIEYTPTGSTLACNNSINLSLDGNCEAWITPDMILEGDDYACLDDYCVVIKDLNGNIIGTSENGTNKLTLAHVNTTVVVSICESCDEGANCCWGYVKVEEKLIPLVDCPRDTILQCNEYEDPALTGYPILLSCEPGISIDYYDDFIDGGNCGNPRAKIERTWTIVDETANVVYCNQEITIMPFDLEMIEFPDDHALEDALDCNDVTANPALTTPDYTGYPTIKGKNIYGEHLCEFNVGYWDERLQDANCVNSYALLRNWVIHNECLPIHEGVNPLRHIQVIKVNDSTAPYFEMCLPDTVISTGGYQCRATFALDKILNLVTDDCGDIKNITVAVVGGTVSELPAGSKKFVITNLTKGVHQVKIRVQDNCRNTTVCTFNVTVVDAVAPNVICHQKINVSLPNDGYARLYPTSVDNESFDNCTDIAFKLIRMTSTCDESAGQELDFVEFCCEDISNSPIMVALRAWDDADEDGVFGSEGDNYADCMVEVKVEDKLTPIIGCPANVNLECSTDVNDLSITGEATVITACNNKHVAYKDVPSLNDCGIGTILREWYVVENPEVKCYQTIKMVNPVPFNGEQHIVWPADYTGSCLDSIPQKTPILLATNCDLVAYSMEDDTFQVVENACYKIIRNWTVIDWCTYKPNFPEQGGIWEDSQFIIIKDQTPPIIASCSDTIVGFVGAECLSGDIVLRQSAIDTSCGINASLIWSYRMDLGGDGTYDITKSNILGNEIKATFAGIQIGTHKIEWTVSDGCGNKTSCLQKLTVRDTKPPTPYCQSGLITVLMEGTGAVEIWAKDFNVNSSDNCTPAADLVYSFSGTSIVPSMTFNCDSLENGISQTFSVNMWVYDAYGNKDFCTVDIVIQDNQNLCTDGNIGFTSISGKATTKSGVGLDKVEIEINTGFTEYPKTFVTDSTGAYSSASNPTNYLYLIGAKRNTNYLEGVTTLDLIHIQRHILGITPFTNVFNVIASDITNDTKVRASDLNSLRKLILGVTVKFENESWRFIDKKDTTLNINDPFPYAEIVRIENFQNSVSDADFIGIKIGDVNGTTDKELLNHEIESRIAPIKLMMVIDDNNTNGETTQLKVLAPQDGKYFGVQMALRHGDTPLDVVGHKLDVKSENQYDKLPVWRLSYDISEGIQLAKGEVLFTINIPRNEVSNVQLDDSIRPEFYIDNNGMIQSYPIQLVWEGNTEVSNSGEMIVDQNIPNPFKNESHFKFTLPKDDVVNISIFDATGALIQTHQDSYKAGSHSYQLNGINYPAGVYTYRVETSTASIAKKFIVIK